MYTRTLAISVSYIHTSGRILRPIGVCFPLHSPVLLQSEDDCDGHETTRYTFFIGDQEVGDMTAHMLDLSFFNKRGDMAVVTLSVLTLHIANSPRFNLSVMLSNTVEFTEVVTSSTDGVSSTLRSNTWSTTSFYCESKLESRGKCTCIVCCLVNKPDIRNIL